MVVFKTSFSSSTLIALSSGTWLSQVEYSLISSYMIAFLPIKLELYERSSLGKNEGVLYEISLVGEGASSYGIVSYSSSIYYSF